MAGKYMIKDAGDKTARARVEDVDVSYKKLAAVCYNVKGMPVDTAMAFLEDVIKKKKAVYFPRWNKKMGHRRELGGKKGRYPIKAAKVVLNLLKNAKANAEAKGLLSPVIWHIAANKQHIYPRISPKGRPMMSNYETAFVEVILKEKE